MELLMLVSNLFVYSIWGSGVKDVLQAQGEAFTKIPFDKKAPAKKPGKKDSGGDRTPDVGKQFVCLIYLEFRCM